jgi:hypothetical protein
MYAFVDKYIGGFGNQLFQYFTLLYICKKYNKIPIMFDQDMCQGFMKILCYKHIFNLEIKDRDEILKNKYESIIPKEQFSEIIYPESISESVNICLDGLTMNIKNFKEIIPEGIKILNKYNKINENRIENLCLIGFRGFKEEKVFEWRIDKHYYKNAIEIIKEKIPDVIFIAYTDDYDYAEKILIENDVSAKIYEGNRDGIMDIKHFYQMFECNHAILTNSSYHLWSMIFNTSGTNYVCIPKNNNWVNQTSINEINGNLIYVDIYNDKYPSISMLKKKY